MATHFFSNDGSYGDAKGILIVDTDQWSEEDWRDIDDACDMTRLAIAKEIEEKHRDKRVRDFYASIYKN